MGGMYTEITVQISVEEAFSNIKSLLIMFPEGFRQDMPSPSRIQNLNDKFPVAAANEWADIENKAMVRLFLDDTEETTTVPPDVYGWRFPVVVPKVEDFPRKDREGGADAPNTWNLVFCTSRLCSSWSSDTAVVVFPIKGFELNEKHPGSHSAFDSFSARWILSFFILALYM